MTTIGNVTRIRARSTHNDQIRWYGVFDSASTVPGLASPLILTMQRHLEGLNVRPLICYTLYYHSFGPHWFRGQHIYFR
jgi:hypothetical protein